MKRVAFALLYFAKILGLYVRRIGVCGYDFFAVFGVFIAKYRC